MMSMYAVRNLHASYPSQRREGSRVVEVAVSRDPPGPGGPDKSSRERKGFNSVSSKGICAVCGITKNKDFPIGICRS